jgi:hypothetical protein
LASGVHPRSRSGSDWHPSTARLTAVLHNDSTDRWLRQEVGERRCRGFMPCKCSYPVPLDRACPLLRRVCPNARLSPWRQPSRLAWHEIAKRTGIGPSAPEHRARVPVRRTYIGTTGARLRPAADLPRVRFQPIFRSPTRQRPGRCVAVSNSKVPTARKRSERLLFGFHQSQLGARLEQLNVGRFASSSPSRARRPRNSKADAVRSPARELLRRSVSPAPAPSNTTRPP